MRSKQSSDIHESIEHVADRIASGERKRYLLDSLCFRCTKAFIYRTRRMAEPVVFCTQFDPFRQMPTDIVECSKFQQDGRLDVWDMARLALLIENTPDGRVGFHVPDEGDDHGDLAQPQTDAL